MRLTTPGPSVSAQFRAIATFFATIPLSEYGVKSSYTLLPWRNHTSPSLFFARAIHVLKSKGAYAMPFGLQHMKPTAIRSSTACTASAIAPTRAFIVPWENFRQADLTRTPPTVASERIADFSSPRASLTPDSSAKPARQPSQKHAKSTGGWCGILKSSSIQTTVGPSSA